MIPSMFIEVDEIPLNPNGKIDKFALRDIVRKDRNLDIEINDDVLYGRNQREIIDKIHHAYNEEAQYYNDSFAEIQDHIQNRCSLLKTPLAIANHIKSDSGIYSPCNFKLQF